MSLHLFARQRAAFTALALCAILAALLPAQRAAAQSIPPIPSINLTREEVNWRIYNTWWVGRISSAALESEQTLQSLLVGNQLLSPANPYDPDLILKQADALQERYIERLGPRGADPEYRASLTYWEVAEAMTAAAVETPFFRDAAKEVYQEQREYVSKLNLSDPIAGAFNWTAYHTFAQSTVLEDAYRTVRMELLDKAQARAKADPTFARAWDHFIISGGDDDEPLKLEDIETFDAQKYLAEHPDLLPPEVKKNIKPDGSLEISLADLEKLAKDEFAKINTSIDEMQKTILDMSKQQGELVDFMKDQQKRQKQQAEAEAKAKAYKLKLEAASSAVYIASTLIGFKDPKLAKQVSVVGNSLIKVGDALHGWMEATAGLSALSKIGSLSTVVMTGNVLGAVMSVVSLFGPQEPTPEQIILEEIGKLRQQVSELRTEMHTRFDQIDKQLNAIYTTMHDRFDQLDLQLGKITGSLAEIQQSLLTLGIALNRMERNNTEYFDAIGRRPLREAMNGALGYKERTGLDMPYQPDFVNYENVFHSWGTLNAFDALSAGPSERDYSDGQVLAELSAAPLDANVNYLNGWLSAHGLRPFATKRLPSPRDWAFASRAYAELGFNWPQHLARISGERQAALDAVGSDLQQALANISTIQTPNGPQGNAPLWSGLTSYYNAKLQALDSALAANEGAFVQELQDALKREGPFDLYGGLDQNLPVAPTDFRTITCGAEGMPPAGVAAPYNLKNIIAGYSRFALADYLALSPLKVCVYPRWVSAPPPCSPAPCTRFGTYNIFIRVDSNDTPLAIYHLGALAVYDENIWNVVAPIWDKSWKPAFEAAFASVATPPSLDPAAAAQLDIVNKALVSKLAELQRAHAGRVLNGLGSGPLQGRAVELAGAKKLLESFIALGFPQAIDNDDFMRSLLFSQESLVDDQQIAFAYATPPAVSATAAISEAQLLLNPRTTLLQRGQKRRDALAQLLTDYLGNISTENYREDSALVGGARFDMQLARAFADPDAPLPGQRWAVFLPVVQQR